MALGLQLRHRFAPALAHPHAVCSSGAVFGLVVTFCHRASECRVFRRPLELFELTHERVDWVDRRAHPARILERISKAHGRQLA